MFLNQNNSYLRNSVIFNILKNFTKNQLLFAYVLSLEAGIKRVKLQMYRLLLKRIVGGHGCVIRASFYQVIT